MTLSRNVTCNSFSGGIWEGSSQSMLSYTPDYEKQGTPIIGIEDLRALGQIIRPIRTRIGSTLCWSFGVGVSSMGAGSYETFGPASSQNIATEAWKR
jgi:hypothetical protein